MTTTLPVNVQELQVSTTVEENAGGASACGCRAASSPQTIASTLEKFHSALKSRVDRATTRPTAEGWSWALERGRTVPIGRSSVVAVWSRWVESSQCAPRVFGALKKKIPEHLSELATTHVSRSDYD